MVDHVESIPFGPTMQIERFILRNGMKVLLVEDHAAPVVAMQMWYAVGSRHERLGKTGLAHLFEHLMFGETEHRPHGAYSQLMEEAGAEVNAATYFDWTHYEANLPKDALEIALRLEAERMRGLVLLDPQVASEKEVVANERRETIDDDVDASVTEILYRAAFKCHAYGWPTIGVMGDILGFTTEDCVEFYGAFYAPNNVTAVLVGDIDPGHTLRMIAELFGSIEPRAIRPEDAAHEPMQTAERVTRIRKATATQKAAIGYRGPALGHEDHVPLSLLSDILFGGRASRAHRALVREKEIATNVSGWVDALHHPGLFGIGAYARGEHTASGLVCEIDQIIESVRVDPVTEPELERVKARVELSTLQGLETARGKAEQLGFYETVLGQPEASFQRLETCRLVTPDDVQRVARSYLDRNARTVIEVVPDR